jgi:ribosome-associated protein
MIKISRTLAIPDSEIEEKFIQSSGPGGQNVNKVATAVQLRFNIDQSTSLPENVKERLKTISKNQITKDNTLIVEAKSHRTQERNRKEARVNFAQIIRKALKPVKKRKKTEPPKGAAEKRLERKKIRSAKKKLRQPPDQSNYP